MTLSVVIPTYNRYHALERTLNSILAADLSSVREIVIVNQSADPLPDRLVKLCSETPLLRMVRQEEPSLPEARNRGIAACSADSELIVFVDDDVDVFADLFVRHAEAYRDPAVMAAGGRELPVGASLGGAGGAPGKLSRLIRPLAIVAGRGSRYGRNRISPGLVIGTVLFFCDFHHPDQPCFLDTVRGCNMSFRASVLREAEGFDEGFTGSARREESDICFRLRARYGANSIAYLPGARLVHRMDRSGGCRGTFGSRQDHLRNELYFISRHTHGPLRRIAASAAARVKVALRG